MGIVRQAVQVVGGDAQGPGQPGKRIRPRKITVFPGAVSRLIRSNFIGEGLRSNPVRLVRSEAGQKFCSRLYCQSSEVSPTRFSSFGAARSRRASPEVTPAPCAPHTDSRPRSVPLEAHGTAAAAVLPVTVSEEGRVHCPCVGTGLSSPRQSWVDLVLDRLNSRTIFSVQGPLPFVNQPSRRSWSSGPMRATSSAQASVISPRSHRA